MEDNIRYSRQSYALGKDASKLLHKSNILVIGYSTLSLEIIKNMVLTGVSCIDINITNNFKKVERYQKTGLYYDNILNDDTIEKIRCLNPSVSIQTITSKYNTIDYTKYNLVIVTNTYFNDAIEINNKTREYNIPFILCGCNGLLAFIFNDFGRNYNINDVDGETYDLLYIESINENKIKFKENHSLGNGDILIQVNGKLMQVNGKLMQVNDKLMQVNDKLIQVNGNQRGNSEYTVKNIISPTEIELTTLPPISVKTLIKKKGTFTVNFSSLHESIITPKYNEHTPQMELLHILNKAHNDFYNMNKREPRVQNDVDYCLFMEYVNNNNLGYGKSIEKLAHKYCKSIRGNVLPFVSIIAGIVSQEAVKVLGNIYMPIEQWLYIDYLDLVKEDKIKIEKSEYYEGYTNVFGKDIFNKIQNTRVFIAGAGAIGCELLKQVGSLGIRNITITDMDNIEKSNLSRQFLFSDKDINKSKSITAMHKIKELFTDRNIKINAFEHKLCKETETIFNAPFYHNVDVILNALDNVEARKYVDQQAIKYSKPLIDSGTMGTKGNVQVILPYLTETYGTMEDPDDDKGIPICTIKSFPYKNEHTIQWARELFEQEFTFMHINNFNCKDISSISESDIDTLYKQYYKYENFIPSHDSYVYVLQCIFIDNYHKNIMELIDKHKDDEIPKKMPILLNIEEYKEIMIDYIVYGFSLLNQVFSTNITYNYNLPHMMNYRCPVITDKRRKCQNILQSLQCIKNKINFNKDDDELNHVDWLVTISNLRNLQYSIPLTDKYETRKIAGKIIPALITTTSIIAGYQIMEFIKIVSMNLITKSNEVNMDEIDITKFTNVYLNTGINFYSYVTPSRVIKKVVNGSMNEISVWDKIEIPKLITNVQHILDIIQRKILSKVEFITWKSNIIYDGDNILVNNIDLAESNAVILVKEYCKQDDNKFIELLCIESQ
jgi:ubiquitin-activating enzyme E1